MGLTHEQWLQTYCRFCSKPNVAHSGTDWHNHLDLDGKQITEIVEVMIAGRWPLCLPQHRAARTDWGTWEKEHIESMADHLGPGDVVYDVGAEEGDFPALWATWGCEVFLFEPNPLVWANIKAIWDANNLPNPLGMVVGFAADEDVDPPDSEWYDVGYAKPRDGWPECAYGEIIGDHGFLNLSERPDVARIRIDTVARQVKPPTAITIDVEGAELAVLLGARGVLLNHKPKVWVSIHPQFSIDMYGRTKDDVLNYMASVGYKGWMIADPGHEEHHLFLPS